MKPAAYRRAPDAPASASDPESEPSSWPSAHPEPASRSIFQSFRCWLKRMPGLKSESSLREALEEVIEEHEEQADEQLAPEERVMLHKVLSFGDIRVSDIMIPRTDISAVPRDITLEALKKHVIEQRHTRIPVYRETLDQMEGFLHVKDLLPMFSGDVPFDIRAVLRDLLFVPPSMRIMDLLARMRHAGSHMAIVVDEYGGNDGLVTMEDVVEELVGDIQDEHDEDEELAEKITRINDRTWEVNARIRIGTLEQELGLSLVSGDTEGEFDTLGGLIFFQLGRVPAKGEIIAHGSGVRFEIMEADSRRIRRVRILKG